MGTVIQADRSVETGLFPQRGHRRQADRDQAPNADFTTALHRAAKTSEFALPWPVTYDLAGTGKPSGIPLPAVGPLAELVQTPQLEWLSAPRPDQAVS